MIAKRPININPLSIRLPIPAWVSIAHRLSGFAVFILIPLLLWLLDYSLSSSTHFNQVADHLNLGWVKLLLFVFFASLLFHFFAGIRHILMDLHWFESLRGGRFTAWIVIALSLVSIAYSAYWIWG